MNKKRVRAQNFVFQKGFTLLEILLAVAAMVILASIVILAINPGKQLADTRNAQRWSDVNTVLNAVYQYSVDHDGDLPGNITASSTGVTNIICRTGEGVTAGVCGTVLATGTSLLIPDYLVGMPNDPHSEDESSGYRIFSVNGRVTIEAPLAERSMTITATR